MPYGDNTSGGYGSSKGGGYSNSKGGGYGSSGSTSKPKSPVPDEQLIKLAGRVAAFAKDPYKVKTKDGVQTTPNVIALQGQVQDALSGFNRHQVKRLARSAALDPTATQTLLRMTNNQKGGTSFGKFTGALLAPVNAPGQAVLGGISEGGSGAVRGAMGQESYTPIQTWNRAVNSMSQREARKAEAALNPWVRFGVNTGGAIATDPASWVSFGTTGLANAGARSAAELIAVKTGQAAAEDVGKSALTAAGTSILTKLASGAPKRVLSKEEYAALKSLPRTLRKSVNKESGGIHVAGKTIPGTRGMLQGLGGKGEAPISRFFSPRAELKAGERAGRYAHGTTQSIENTQAALRGGAHLAGIAGDESSRLARSIYGRGWKKLTEAELGPVRRTLEGKTDEVLNENQQKLVDGLSRIGEKTFGTAKESARLLPDSVALGRKQEAAARSFDPKIQRAEEQVGRIERQRYSQSGKYANALGNAGAERRLAAARGDVRAVERATQREQQLQLRAVEEQQKIVQHGAQADVIHARSIERDAIKQTSKFERGVKAIEREIDQQKKIISRSVDAAERRGAQLKLRSLESEHDATLASWHEAAQKVDAAVANRVRLEMIAARAKGATVPHAVVPPSIASVPIRNPGEAAAAATRLSREQTKLRILENLKKSSEGRVSRLESKQAAAVRSQRVITQKEYYPNVPSQAARETSAKLGDRAVTSIPGRTPGTFLRRTDNRLAEEKLIEQGPHAGIPRVEQNPIVAVGEHAKQVTGDAARVQAFHDLENTMDSAGMPLMVSDPEAIKNLEGSAQYVPIKAPVTRRLESGDLKTLDESVLIHKSVAEDFKRMTEFNSGSQSSKAVLNGMKYVNALWARYATATTGFISRNVLQGNLYMGMVLAGARDPREWGRALGVMHRMSKGIKEAADPYRFLKPGEVGTVKEALSTNAVESNFMSLIEGLYESSTHAAVKGPNAVGNVLRGIRHRLATSKTSPVSPNFLPVEKIAEMNQWAESWSRLAVYMNKRKQGLLPADAAAVTRKYMLDYTDLAKAAQVGKYANPFLTWAYKTAPLIVGTALKDPKKITIPLHILEGVGSEGEQPGVVPQWVQEAGGITLPKTLRENLPLGLNKQGPIEFIPADPVHSVNANLQPIADVVKVLRGDPTAPKKLLADTINSAGLGGLGGGLAQSTFEGATGTEVFSGRQVQPGTQVDLPGVGKVPWEVANTVNSILPALARVNAIAPTTDYDKTAQGRRIASMLAGFTVQPINKKTQAGEFYRRLEQLAAALRKEGLTSGDLPDASASKGYGG